MNEYRYHLGIDSSRHPLLAQWIRANPWRWQKAARDVLEAVLQKQLLPTDLRDAKWTASQFSLPTESAASPLLSHPRTSIPTTADATVPSKSPALERTSSESLDPEVARREMQERARQALMKNDF